MKLQKLKRAFTLIELLVVITIIGILATWAVNVYTSQIQKARDSTRITDVNALRTWIEQLYQDAWAYPNAWAAITTWIATAKAFIDIKDYVPKLPKDPKTGQKSWNANFDYTYAVAADSNLVWFQIFEVATHFEQEANVTEKAAADGWNDDFRLELWISLGTLISNINTTTPWASWVDSATPTYQCRIATGTTWTCPTASVSGTANAIALIIK